MDSCTNITKMGVEEQITLCQLQSKIKDSIESNHTGRYWIKAEISEVKNPSMGHCYLDLVDKPSGSESITAKAQAIIWANNYRLLKPYFETTTGQALSRGMHILVNVQVQYSTLYGLSLIILDIDPSFTVGEQELERQKTIKRLKEEGMFEMNRTLELPQLPKRLAVISSEQAAGYRDFFNHLHMNEYGFKFKTTLFSAPMQGLLAPEGIIAAMDSVAENLSDFDILLILRGGGSSQDLICFDDYNLASNIAQFPIPVMVGIGHDHDYHIVDMVAHTSVKTPTALADFIVDIFIREDQQIVFLSSRLSLSLREKIQFNYHKIELLEQRIYSNNPFSLFNKGYALVVKDGAKIVNISQVEAGDNIKVMLKGGSLNCIISNKSNEKKS